MTLKPLEPLPYDFVDEWIDSRIEFEVHNAGDRIYYVATRRDHTYSCYERDLFSVYDDVVDEYDEDEEGYVFWHGGGSTAWKWTAEEPTDEQVDRILECRNP